MKKPIKKREVAIKEVRDSSILLDASSEAANHFSEFGRVYHQVADGDTYLLFVDARYDFNEVVEYIRSYGSQRSELTFVVKEAEG